MIRATSIQTTAIDDIPSACDSLKEQLDKKLKLLKNSVGIIQCDPEFIEAGIMEPLSDMLGIPLVGGTTAALATNDEIGTLIFSLLVLTSDDVEFAAARTTGLKDECSEAIRRSVKTCIEASKKPLKMALVFPTITDNEDIPGDIYIETMVEICGNIPVFGTLSVDDAVVQYDRSMSVFNKDAFKSELSYVLIFGNVQPRFFVATVPTQSNITASKAIITKTEGQTIYEINNLPTYGYFESVGLAADGKLKQGVYFMPLLITTTDADGAKRTIVRAILDFNPDGSTSCRGKVPQGATIDFGSLQAADILSATSDIVAKINQEDDVSAVLIFSCIIRRFNTGSDGVAELTTIKNSLHSDIPFMASYAGGEICPVGCDGKGKFQNSFHNYSLIACLL